MPPDEGHVLEDRIGSSLERRFSRKDDLHGGVVQVTARRPGAIDVCNESIWLVLRDYVDVINARIDQIAEHEVDKSHILRDDQGGLCLVGR